jgi:hypothetical protein
VDVIQGGTGVLTPTRVRIAYGIAATVDVCQWLLGPAGFAFPDEILDVVAGVLISAAIGFHPLLLPAFILEFLPIVDLLPTWTASVALVVMLRRTQEPPPPGPGQVIDV